MNKKIYIKELDSIRGIACLYVLLHNFVYGLYAANLVNYKTKLLFSAGQEAVIIFFLLSGFVVQLSTEQNPRLNFRVYFIKRFRRIYFPLIISVIVSIVIFYFNGNLYKKFSWIDLGGTFLLLQDFGSVKPGTWFYPFLGNLPLWSLSYEWWFYIMYYPFYKALSQNDNRIYVVLGFSIVSYLTYQICPNQVSLICSYFIIWWTGVELATVFFKDKKFIFNKIRKILLGLLVMSLISLIPLLRENDIQYGYYPFLIFRHFFSALLWCILGFGWYKIKLLGFQKIVGIFSKLAPISYGIYVLQYPILVQWRSPTVWPLSVVSYGIKFVIIIGLAYLIEMKLQPVVNKWIK